MTSILMEIATMATAPEPRAPLPTYTPTPTQAENDMHAEQQSTNTLPPLPHYHKMDGSEIEPSFDPTPITTPTWP